MKQEMQKAHDEGFAAYMATVVNYENPYLADFQALKARKWDEGFEAAMVTLARGE